MPIPEYGILEAESFDLTQGFRIVDGASIRGDYVNVPRIGSASMRTTVEGAPGVYDLVVYYYDENDGEGSTEVVVDGRTVGRWTWDENFGSSMASERTYTSHVIRNVEIRETSEIVINGRRVDAESLRIDKVVLAPPANRAVGGPDEAFPGAEGFGSDTPGGRGGWIVKVTNLNDSGVGSLRWALEDLDMPRIVVFEVGGVINLRRAIEINGDVTVAGQTAPGEGVTVRGGQLQVEGSNVVISGLKIRPGDGPGHTFETRDAISIGARDQIVENVVIDGNSLTWSVDEVIDIWHGARNITISNNIIAEALRNSNHPQGDHSMGLLASAGARNITVVNNLFMSNEFRNPTFAEATNIEVVNNFVYNYGQHGLSFTMQDMFVRGHVIGNVFEKGPSTGDQSAVRIVGTAYGGEFYLRDNISADRPNSSDPESDVATGRLSQTLRDRPVFSPSDVSAMSSGEVKAYVLANAGARAQGLDRTDARLLAEAANGRGSLKDSPTSGAYSISATYAAPRDRDGDGIPDAYEAAVGGDPNYFDPHVDGDGDGYSNIEDYINSLLDRTSSGSSASRPPSQPDASPPQPDPAPSQPDGSFRVEAEDFALVRGFYSAPRPIASGGAIIETTSDSEAVARYVFSGASGVYDLALGYYDENDGQAWMRVLLNGDEIDDWQWNQNLGDSGLSLETLTERRIADVALRGGDVIELRGYRDGGREKLRTDYLDFALDGASDAPREAAFRVEAEEFQLVQNFRRSPSGISSGDAMIEATSGTESIARFEFREASGVYDLALGYYDENDGVARMRVLVNGREVDDWLWNQNLGVDDISREARTDRDISNVELRTGDVIELRGYRDGGAEKLRTDYLDFVLIDELVG